VAGTIAQIWRYPIKSMAGERLESTAITPGGLEGDRRWTLVDGSPNRAGKMLTNTQDARLMTYKARLVGNGVEVTTPSGSVERLGNGLVSHLAETVERPLTLRDSARCGTSPLPMRSTEPDGVVTSTPFPTRRAL